jgi:hypothetical protein
MENECFGCGCTDTKACVTNDAPCHWLVLERTLGLGVCSSCPEHVEPFEQHQAELTKIAEQGNKRDS